jgi:hypothetical protein
MVGISIFFGALAALILLVIALVTGVVLVGGIAFLAYRIWHRYRQLLKSLSEVERLREHLKSLELESRGLRRRIENLETIVVSEIVEKVGPDRASLSTEQHLESPSLE